MVYIFAALQLSIQTTNIYVALQLKESDRVAEISLEIPANNQTKPQWGDNNKEFWISKGFNPGAYFLSNINNYE